MLLESSAYFASSLHRSVIPGSLSTRVTSIPMAKASFTICDDARTPQQAVWYKVPSVMPKSNIYRGEDIFASLWTELNLPFVCLLLSSSLSTHFSALLVYLSSISHKCIIHTSLYEICSVCVHHIPTALI